MSGIETPLMEIILRRYESPHNISQRDTLKRICLSLGLLQPGDSRDVIVDILLVLEKYKVKKKELTIDELRDEVIASREDRQLTKNGTADSNIRRQVKRLREVFLVEKKRNKYKITEFMNLENIFEEKVKPIILNSILSRNQEFFKYYRNSFENNQ